jgi:hypothetical protein
MLLLLFSLLKGITSLYIIRTPHPSLKKDARESERGPVPFPREGRGNTGIIYLDPDKEYPEKTLRSAT